MIHDATAIRPLDGQVRLLDLLAQRMRTPFAWGAHDCCLFAADAVLAQTGVDHAQTLRGTYDSALGAARVLADHGGIEAIGARAGEPIGPLFARLGDIGLVDVAGRQSLAVCVGTGWLAPATDGLATLPLKAATSAWRVA